MKSGPSDSENYEPEKRAFCRDRISQVLQIHLAFGIVQQNEKLMLVFISNVSAKPPRIRKLMILSHGVVPPYLSIITGEKDTAVVLSVKKCVIQ